MLTSSDRAEVLPILRSIGAFVYLVDVLDGGSFQYFAVNWAEDADIELPYKGSMVGKGPEGVFNPEHAARITKFYQQCIGERAQLEFEGSYDSASGKRYTNHVLSPLFDLNGQVVRIMGTIVDITSRKKAEWALKESEARFHSLYDDNPARFMTIDRDGRILSINKFGAETIGYDSNDLVGKSIFDYLLAEDHVPAKGLLQAVTGEPGSLHRDEFRTRKKDGAVLWTSDTARMIKDTKGNDVILVVSEDISETCKLADDLAFQATHDSLTGLINRREFERRLHHILEAAQTNKSHHALLYMDLDQFKIINDIYGHIAGDELLRQISTLLQKKIGAEDTLARLGGDEFGVLLVDADMKRAEVMSRTLCEVVENYLFFWKEKSYNIGVSIGVVPITEASGNSTNLLSAADRACYTAKDKGRNRIHVYREDDAELEKQHGEMEWANRIKNALTEDRLHLFFQPIAPINGKTQAGEHYELLLRLEDEEGTMVSSAEFLPAAERYSLITKIDTWVIDSAFAWFTKNPRELDKLSLCAINLSGTTLSDESFLEFVTSKFDTSVIPPEKICFEITETAAITHLSSTMRFMQVLQVRGCKFSLDDFGSGLSSFAYLKNLPVDYLKIDGAFVKDIVEDPVYLALVKSINDIGHVMGKKTIAEFVENDAILGKLQEIGVDFYQGYGIGRPQSIQQKLLNA